VRGAIVALAILAALVPVESAAISTPDPAMLKSALADAPSSDYVEAGPGTKAEGPFDAASYAAFITTDTTKQTAVKSTLDRDGFVSGFGRLWAKTGAGAALVEQILAFNDHSGAMTYYGTSRLGDISASYYTGAIDTSSIPASYGARELISGAYTSAIVFVKGNDLFAVGLVSVKDYLVTDTISQGQKVYSAAPDYTIQPASSVGTAATDQLASKVGALIVGILLVALGLGVVLAIIWFVMSRRRRPALQAAAVGPMVQMSGDSRFWWDGSSWQDANAVVPAHAQRTPDGAYWWDGQAWHQVPRSQ
jgi:hypothetical protein